MYKSGMVHATRVEIFTNRPPHNFVVKMRFGNGSTFVDMWGYGDLPESAMAMATEKYIAAYGVRYGTTEGLAVATDGLRTAKAAHPLREVGWHRGGDGVLQRLLTRK